MRSAYVYISPAQLVAGGGQQDVDYVLDRPPFTRYFWNGDDFQPASGGPIIHYTAAQLSAMALAGTLTPLAMYVPSDASPPYQLWARDASTLIAPDGFVANSAASMAALSLAVVGARCTRTDDISGGPDGTEYMLMRLPSTRPHHWKPVYNGAAHMLFSARPNAADVPYGTVIACTDLLNARFVAQTKAGITDWFPEGGEQIIARWDGEVDLYTATTGGALILTKAAIIPAGVEGLYGSLSIDFHLGQLYNTTASGTPLIYVYGKLDYLEYQAGYSVPALNTYNGVGTSVSASHTIVNKKASTIRAGMRMLGNPQFFTSGPEPAQYGGNSAGFQVQYGYRTMEADRQLDVYSAANLTNCAGKLIGVNVKVRG